MRISREKVNHLSNLIVKDMEESEDVSFLGEAVDVRINIVRAITNELAIDDEIDEEGPPGAQQLLQPSHRGDARVGDTLCQALRPRGEAPGRVRWPAGGDFASRRPHGRYRQRQEHR